MSEDLGRLPDELRAEVARRAGAVDERAQLERISRALERPKPAPRWRWAVAVSGAVAIAAAVAFFLVLRPASTTPSCSTSQGPLSVGGYVIAEQPDALRFSDGSLMELEAGTRARLAGALDGEVRVTLEEGVVTSAIQRGTGRWSIEAGPWRISVLGTRFRTTWHPPDLDVVVDEGLVEVVGKGTTLRVGGGQRFQSSPGDDAGPEAQAAQSLPDASLAPSPPVVRVTAPQRPLASPRPRWKDLATQERYREALEEVDRDGEQAVLANLEAWDGLQLSDAARFAGRPELAWRALNVVRQRHPGSAPAALAAFRLGRTRFQEGAFEEAVGWFDRFLAEAPSNELVEDARGKRMEALALASRLDDARRAAVDYLRLHPRGPHAARARALAATP